MSSTFEINLPAWHSGQRQAVEEARRFNVLACGRRWGKTLFEIDRAAYTVAEGGPVGWFAPTYKILLDAMQQAIRAFGDGARVSKSEKVVAFPTGGLIEFWSLQDEDAGRSRRYKRVIVDEAGMVPNLKRIWHEAIRPTLVDFEGDAWFGGTPKGRNFFWEAFEMSDVREEWKSWRFPTSSNPFVSVEEIEAAKESTPERYFRQEYMAEFLEDAGGVFHGVAACVEPGSCNGFPEGNGRYTMGVDLGRTEDYTVLTVVDSTGVQRWFERFGGIGWEEQVARIESLAVTFDADVVVDATGLGDPIYERLCARGLSVLPYKLSHSSKSRVIDHLSMRLERGQVRLLDVPVQTLELQAYEYAPLPGGGVRTTAPEGMHDDCVVSLALACWGALDQWEAAGRPQRQWPRGDQIHALLEEKIYERERKSFVKGGKCRV